ncbi:hypothetical protein PSE_2410 [Pseudovibrio sp. FO-BEG1]|nr:hypothetical protein PSE_2410 [Pseudovibrio sp. FO-BEG1]
MGMVLREGDKFFEQPAIRAGVIPAIEPGSIPPCLAV